MTNKFKLFFWLYLSFVSVVSFFVCVGIFSDTPFYDLSLLFLFFAVLLFIGIFLGTAFLFRVLVVVSIACAILAFFLLLFGVLSLWFCII